MGEESGFGASVTTNELLNMYLDKTSDIYLPVVKAEKESVSRFGNCRLQQAKALLLFLMKMKPSGF